MVGNFGSDPIPGLAQLRPETTYLRILSGPKANQFFSLNRLRSVIGRSHPPNFIADIDLSGCEQTTPPTISRQHAVIQWGNNKLQIIDLASRNGTFVNGEQLLPLSAGEPSAPVALTAGSKIKLGNLELEIVAS